MEKTELNRVANEFSALVVNKRRILNLSIARFACEAGVGPNSVISAETGELVRAIFASPSSKKRKGIARTIIRITHFCDASPRKWCEQLKLPYFPHQTLKSGASAAMDEILAEIKKLKVSAPDTSGLLDAPITLEQVENLALLLKATPTKTVRLRIGLELIGFKADVA